MFGDIMEMTHDDQDMNEKPKYGVRVFKVSYVIDGQKERHVKVNDDSSIADAVRDGIAGKLTNGRK